MEEVTFKATSTSQFLVGTSAGLSDLHWTDQGFPNQVP